MGIGTSLGAFYRDDGHYAASKWDDRYDDNVVKPQQMETNKEADAAEVSPSGPGIPIGYWPAANGKDDVDGPPVKIDNGPAPVETPSKGFFDRLSILNAVRGMDNPSFGEDINMLKGLYETAKRGLTLPGEVASGKVDPSSTEAVDRAADLAMMAVGGSAGTATKGTLGSGVVFKPPLELGEAGLAKLSNKEYAQYLKDYNSYNKQKASFPEDMPKYKSYIDMYMDQHSNKVEDLLKGDKKLSFKEAFLQAAEETHTAFTAAASDIKAAFKAAAKEPDNLISAGKKGYDQPAYRGVKLHVGEGEVDFNPVHGKAGERSHMYSSDSPLLADMYSSYLSSHPGFNVPPGTFSEGASVMPLYINTKNYHYYDAKGGSWETNNARAIGDAIDQGKHGVIVDNVWDEPNSTKALGSPKKVFITFPEGAHTVKSRFAKKFDEKSENIMHGIGVGGPAGYVSYQDLSDKDSDTK